MAQGTKLKATPSPAELPEEETFDDLTEEDVCELEDRMKPGRPRVPASEVLKRLRQPG